ncbi:RNA-directed DNA polymerase, eukaryota [Tanacetum coccineum]
MLVANSTEICQILNADLNGNLFSVQISEERFEASSLVSPPLCDRNQGGFSVNHDQIDDYDYKVGSVFEEVFVGCVDDSVGPSIEINSNLIPNGSPPSMTFNQAQVACPIDLVESIENLILNGPCFNEMSNESVPNLNFLIVGEGENVIQDDPELDDLLSSFQRISKRANDNHSKCEKMRKSKPRKKNLVVGGALCPPPLVSHSDDAGFVRFAYEECTMKIIEEHIGFSFRLQVGSMDQSRSYNKRSWIRNMIKKDSPMFLEVQETKLESFDPSFIRSLWPHSDVEFIFSSAIGALGGILTIDFNAMRNINERLGSQFDEGEANAFNDFILQADLFDLPLGGRRFTRFSKDGNNVSKLDRFMVSQNFFDIWNDASVSVLYIKVEAGQINYIDFEKREEWLMDLDHLDQLHIDGLKQKSLLKWAMEGNENIHFFHSILKYKYANFNIKGIHVDGIWCESPDLIKEAVVRQFSSRFQEDNKSRPTFSSSLFRRLSGTDANLLEANITMEEIRYDV